jgi:hypothetical protein
MPYPHQFIPPLRDEERRKISSILADLALKGKWQKRQRVSAVWFSDQGHTKEQISQLLKVSYRSLTRWFSLYRKGGLDALL